MHGRATAVVVMTILGLGAGRGPAEEVVELAVSAGQPAAHPALLHGRVTTVDGETYRGRLRFGVVRRRSGATTSMVARTRTPWIGHVPAAERPRRGIRLVGLQICGDAAAIQRPFMARMGDIAKLEARGRDLWVTMKSGTVHHLDRYSADDFSDGVRV